MRVFPSIFCFVLSFCYHANTISAVDDRSLADAFLISAFPQMTNPTGDSLAPEVKSLWFSSEIKAKLARDFDFHPQQLRLRYWVRAASSAWIVDEIGKERPITIGVVVSENKIERVAILAYRESRGGEVQQTFFTDQYKMAVLDEKSSKLNRSIDGITGATLSVRAVTKIARVALYLDQVARQKANNH